MKCFHRIKPFAALLTGLMLLVTLVAVPVTTNGYTMAPKTTPEPGEQAEGAVIEVKDVDELVAAIGPGVTLELAAGDYDLAAAANYGKDTGNPYCHWTEASEKGYELQIVDADGLTLRGAGMDETTILAQDRYACVLCFVGCRDLTLAQLTAGHSPEPGVCGGGVLRLDHCEQVTVEGCGLFGCGTIGVWATNCNGVTVNASRIYECSDNAVCVDSCLNVQVLDSQIDHNGWKNEYAASALFQTYGGDGFTVSGCSIHDNIADLLLQCAYTGHAAFVSNQVAYNTLQSAFSLQERSATVDGCAFHGNYMNSWYAYGEETSSLPAQDQAGQELTEEALSAMEIRPIQLVGTEEIVLQEPTEVPLGGEIVVTTVDEFLAAIGPDRTIVLKGSNFSLADAADYGGAGGWYYRWEQTYDGPQLVIYGASNLEIRSEAKDPAAITLTATPRYADVICFQSCENLRIDGLTLGHTEGPSECSGAVLNFENCSSVLVSRCRLYGCGTIGVNAMTCRNLRVVSCEIYDCSISGVVLYTVSDAAFQNCSVHDVPSPMLCFYDTYGVAWNGTTLSEPHYDVTADGEAVPVELG